MTLGVLTLATANDYQKAIGLSLSIRVSNPGVPIAVACSQSVRKLIEPFFDIVVDEDPSVRGFAHKLHLDLYSPFEETFFFDSDVLVFRPLSEVIHEWRHHPYTACGGYVLSGTSPFGLDRDKVLKLIKKDRLVHIDGAGHAYFRRHACTATFAKARSIASDYESYAGNIMLADEDVMDIVMTMLELTPMPPVDFWSRYLTGKPGTVKIDATKGICLFENADTGQEQRPHMMHFAANEAPFVYLRQLVSLYQAFGVSPRGLLATALHDFYLREVRWPIGAHIRRSFDRAQSWLNANKQ